jgi:hypothetical protein
MNFKYLCLGLVTLLTSTLIVLLSAGSLTAFAQTTVPGYPGPTTTTTPTSNIINQNLGSFTVGNTFTANSCGFAPTSTVSLSLNTTSIGSQSSPSNGCVTIQIKVISANTSGATLQINGNNYQVPLLNDTLTAKGTGSNGAPLTVVNNFSITVSVPGATPQTGKPFFGEELLASILIIAGIIFALLFWRIRKTR